ncbi:hypothetical protein BGZ70_007157 [Mortierella alpina]|uniref:VPS9 domain-containing protein n=1 Tax=Mortierella alpina TaxID=64518 RepID=A0A9P6J739_MORAP|nr:hypothetical protein BGZ70_007157 [Mortierella alpina]
MQNIPGLSFFDGLTRSRATAASSSTQRSSASASGSPLETPLRDGAHFSSVRNVKSSSTLSPTHSSDEHGLQSDPFDDPLSSSASSSSSASALPAASFSRRAATVSSSSPLPGLPTRRTSGASTTSRSSILSRDSIYSAPILNRQTSSSSTTTTETNAGSSGSQAGRERSSSIQKKETMEPTAKDVELMAMGTQAYTILKRIQEHPIELADIIRLLVTKKAILILPTAAASTEDPTPSRAYFEDHVIIPESNHGESLFVTLSGIRGLLKPASSSITILGLASGQDFGTLISDASGPIKRSFFDNISKAEGSEGSTITQSPDNELKLVNSSKRPVVIFVESVGSVHALLVDNAIPKQEGDEAPKPIVPLAQGLATVKDRSAARRTASSGSSVRSMTIAEDRDATPLPKMPKIASDLPLEWDSMIRDLESLSVRLRKSPLPNADRYANEFQRKYDDVRHRFEVYGKASGLSHRWSEQDFDEVQQWVEAWLCRELYHVIFPHSTYGINSRDYLQDEQLQAKIAALNFLDLTLEHLGFVLEHHEDVEHIAQVVREGGVEMQKLALVRSPSDKMNVILSSHRVVVDALNREPAVQDMLAEVDEPKEAIPAPVPVLASQQDGDVAAKMNKSKRLSMPKILMDGVIPRADSGASISGSRSPKIPMDEGFERSSMSVNEAASEETSSSTETTGDRRTSATNVKEKAEQVEDAEGSKAEDGPVNVPSEVSRERITSDDAAKVAAEDGKNGVEDGNEEKGTKDINPAEIELPKSPEPSTPTIPSLIAPEEQVAVAESAESTSGTKVSLSQAPQPSSRKQYSADVLLPLLIFSVVKSNPPMLISNLRYIQRFKVQDHLTGELAYCLTNMMAVVSFLETLEPQALGLSSDIKVMSDMSDIQAVPGKHIPPPLLKFQDLQEGLDQTKALGHKVSQEIVGVAEEGIKVISDVVQDGYSKFFGRFLTTADGAVPNRGSRSMSAASSLAATAAAAARAEDERMKRMAEESKRGVPGLVSPAGVTKDITALNVDSSTTADAAIEKSSPHDSAMEHAARNRVLDVMRSSQGPQIQFMACTNADDLRLSDVKSLLEDYQRIGKILEDMKRLC